MTSGVPDAPDPHRLLKLAKQTLSSSERRKRYRQIDFWGQSRWYPSQLKFFAAGSTGPHQRLLYGGSQSGKTSACAAEVAWHAMGGNAYPPWWEGKRFTKPLLIWVVSESLIVGRDTVQKKLCGDQDFGTGFIPLESLCRKPIMVAGGMNAIDTLFVQHVDAEGNPDGVSQIRFLSYEQKREKLQGATVDLVWADEKAPLDVYSELLARTSACDGHLICSYTPVGPTGGEGVTYKYLNEYSADRVAFRISSEEIGHISAERRADLANEYSDAERGARIEGYPQSGSAPVFPTELFPGMIKTFDPDSLAPWCRHVVGIDFGHTEFAAVWIAWDPQAETMWIIDSFTMQKSSALYHVQRLHNMTRGLRVAVSWPHDGYVADKGSGLGLAAQYRSFGANFLPSHALNYGTTNYNVEVGIEEIRGMMFGGKLVIAGHNTELIEQLKSYHRDESFRIAKIRDHLVDAFRYAVMGKRQGRPLADYDGIGIGGLPYAGQRRQQGGQRFARGIEFDLFTGE